MSGLVASGSGGGSASPFLILLAAVAPGRKSATAAAITTASAPFTAARIGSRSCSAEPARTTCTDGRVAQLGGVRGDQRDLRAALRGHRGQRVALPAGRAVAQEPHRVQRLPGATGRHHHPPALEVARQRRRPAPAASRASSAISTGSGSRPGPVSAPVSRPDAGSITTTPRERSSATLSRVAGCSHISVCIAGAISTGQRAVSRVAVSRSSARPCAARASRSAVAGATTTRSACCPSLTCGTAGTSVNTPVCTGCPDSASKVAAPTNSSADAVGSTRTACPLSVSRRSSSALL